MIHVDIVLIDGFSLLSLSGITEPMRIANRECMQREFNWRFLSSDGKSVRSSSGIELRVDSKLDLTQSDVIILLASYNVEHAVEPFLINWLRIRAYQGTLMGCVDTGSYIFAKAGLLQDSHVAVHHESLSGYSIDFPDSLFTDKMFTFTPKLCSSAGGAATFDMTLEMIRYFINPLIAERVIQILNYNSFNRNQPQGLFPQEKFIPKVDRNLARCIEIMIGNIDEPLTLEQVSKLSSITLSTMHRLFKRHLKTTPSKYYMSIRLEQARNLLRSSHEKVGVIASNCGFESLEAFSRTYKRTYKKPPSKDRAWNMNE